MASINHMAHPSHELSEVQSNLYVCDGCWEPGRGRAYACRRCDFFLHPNCFSCPRETRVPGHRQHLLILNFKRATGSTVCDLCYKRIRGLYYTCNHCDYDAHLTCAREAQERAVEDQVAAFVGLQVRTMQLLTILSIADDDSD